MEQISKRLMNWASILEDNTREQAVTTSEMPFIHPHLALMPDAHLGKGATVGSVIPTLGAIMPAAVGVDIGCGMIAVRDPVHAERPPRPIKGPAPRGHRAPRSRCRPASTTPRSTPTTAGAVAELEARRWASSFRPRPSPELALQLGSLGSGNHFIEVSLDEDDRVWLFLHSGSRASATSSPEAHQGRAGAVREAVHRPARPGPGLPRRGRPEFWSYMEALRWAQRFAYLNREEMMDRVIDCF
jgi:tRNA-splicing ligase RtcB